jgi:hypothetical protein
LLYIPTSDLPIGHIAESESGNKHYFDLGQSQEIFKIIMGLDGVLLPENCNSEYIHLLMTH